jgi:hypothetical protein
VTLSIVDCTGENPGKPPPKYPVFGTERVSLNLIAGPDIVGKIEGSAFALALDAAR